MTDRRGPGIIKQSTERLPMGPRFPGQVQMVISTWTEFGWLTTKRSAIVRGGRHGEIPMLDDDLDKTVEILTGEVRGALRAQKHRLEQERAKSREA